MKNILTIIIIFISIEIYSQANPNEYFIECAKMYTDNKIYEAKERINYALSLYPDNEKLLALKKYIDEEKDKQDEQKKQDKQNKEQDQQQNEEQKQQQKNNQEEDKKEDQQQQQQQQQIKISKEDAERILQALANEEKDVRDKVEKEKAKVQKVRVLKNW